MKKQNVITGWTGKETEIPKRKKRKTATAK